jgi:MoaA/NifB/PqqE/SkfB family radical SAM enzyme
MDLIKNISLMKDAIRANLFGTKIPILVYFLVTNKCDSRCKMCDVTFEKKNEMSTEEIKSILDQLYKLGTKKLYLTGGDPLLRDDIKEIIDYSKKKGFFITLGSNLFLVPEKIDEIRNIDILNMNLDGGVKEVHESQRGRNSFNKIIKGVKAARENCIRVVSTTVITKNNVNRLDEVVDLAKRLDFLASFQTLLFKKVDGVNTYVKSIYPDLNEYKVAIKRLIHLKKKGLPIYNSISSLRKMYYWPAKIKLKCWAGKTYCYINPKGLVYHFPCENSLKTGGRDCLKLGVKKAFESLPDNICNKHCYSSVEFNLLFSLDIKSIFDVIRFRIF